MVGGPHAATLELREITHNECSRLKQASFINVRGTIAPNAWLYIHDNVCSCSWLDSLGMERMLDRFHADNHTTVKCKAKWSPEVNMDSLKEAGVANTQCVEQLWRSLNVLKLARVMGPAKFRCLMRHAVMLRNRRPLAALHRKEPPPPKSPKRPAMKRPARRQ